MDFKAFSLQYTNNTSERAYDQIHIHCVCERVCVRVSVVTPGYMYRPAPEQCNIFPVACHVRVCTSAALWKSAQPPKSLHLVRVLFLDMLMQAYGYHSFQKT